MAILKGTNMISVERMLLRHASTKSPETRLVAAILARAIMDQTIPGRRKSAEGFLEREYCAHLCMLVGLSPSFVREMALRWKQAKSKGDQHA